MARAKCLNSPTERIVPDWPCVPYHNDPVMNEAPPRHIMQLQPPPDHRGGSGLAGARLSGPALPGAVHADAQIEVIGRLPSECWPSSFLRPAADGSPGIYPLSSAEANHSRLSMLHGVVHVTRVG
jgi:hypothetical protein